MSNGRFSSYGRALYELVGNDRKLLKEYEEALDDIERDLEENPSLFALLSSHSLPKEKQYEIVSSLYERYNLEHLVPFLKMLLSRHLMVKFTDVVDSYKKAVNEAFKRSEGIVYSATPLTKEEVKDIEKAIGERLQKEVKLVNRVEPSILGGVRVFVDDKSFDGSLESKIEKMRSSLLKSDKGGK